MTPGEMLATYRAFNARDIDAGLAVLAADVDWPNGMDGGGTNHAHGDQEALGSCP